MSGLRCETCKWWDVWTPDSMHLGSCRNVRRRASIMDTQAFIWVEHGGDAFLITARNFCCSMWEPREEGDDERQTL